MAAAAGTQPPVALPGLPADTTSPQQPFSSSLQAPKDAFDAANFNAVAYINEMFPTGESCRTALPVLQTPALQLFSGRLA